MAGIRLHELAKRYSNGFEAVKGINLEIADGEFVVLIGPSGCGKSTTLRTIAGLERITSGSIYLGDTRVDTMEPSKRNLAMVFQDYALYPQMTVRQNMSFGLRMRKTRRSEIDQRVSDAARALAIAELLDLRPDQLSGGQCQRVAVGRAIVRHPTAFLFDEPLSNLDANLRVDMRAELARLHQRMKVTTIYVTHDQVEAMTLGDRIVVMNEGQIVQIDSAERVYQQPANRFVAGFFGSPPMNFIDGFATGSHFRAEDGMDYPLVDKSGKPTFTSLPRQACTLGVRPENLSTDSSHPKLADAVVDVVEYLGHEKIVYATVGDTTLVTRVDRNLSIQRGESIRLHVPPGDWHLFSAERSPAGDYRRLGPS